MSILTAASNASVARGLEYYLDKKVLSWSRINQNTYAGYVKGSGNEEYYVTIDVNHPRKSTCNCPYAQGNVRVCKHKVALFFQVFPGEANALIEDIGQPPIEYDNPYEDIVSLVDSLSEKGISRETIRKIIELYGFSYPDDW